MWCLFQFISVIPCLQFGHFPSCLSHSSFTSPNRILLVLRFRSSSSFFLSVGMKGFKALGVFMCLIILVSIALIICLPYLMVYFDVGFLGYRAFVVVRPSPYFGVKGVYHILLFCCSHTLDCFPDIFQEGLYVRFGGLCE